MKRAYIKVTDEIRHDLGLPSSGFTMELWQKALLLPDGVEVHSVAFHPWNEVWHVRLAGDGLPDGVWEDVELWTNYRRELVRDNEYVTRFEGFAVPPRPGPPTFIRTAGTEFCFWCILPESQHLGDDRRCPRESQPLNIRRPSRREPSPTPN